MPARIRVTILLHDSTARIISSNQDADKTVISPFNSIIALVAAGDFTNVPIQGEPRHLVGQMPGKFETFLPDTPFVRYGKAEEAHPIERRARLASQRERYP